MVNRSHASLDVHDLSDLTMVIELKQHHTEFPCTKRELAYPITCQFLYTVEPVHQLKAVMATSIHTYFCFYNLHSLLSFSKLQQVLSWFRLFCFTFLSFSFIIMRIKCLMEGLFQIFLGYMCFCELARLHNTNGVMHHFKLLADKGQVTKRVVH